MNDAVGNLLKWACEGLPQRSTDDLHELIRVLGRLEEAEEAQVASGVREADEFLKSTRHYLAQVRAERDFRKAGDS